MSFCPPSFRFQTSAAVAATKTAKYDDPTDGTSGSADDTMNETKKYVANNNGGNTLRNPNMIVPPTRTTLLNQLWCHRQKHNTQIVEIVETGEYHVLATERRFNHIQNVLEDTTIDSGSWLCNDCNGPLHHLLKYKPPLKTVSMVCEVLAEITKSRPPPELLRDKYGFTPLHVACVYGCSAVVVARLVNGSTSTTTTTATTAAMTATTNTTTTTTTTDPPISSSNTICSSGSSIMAASYSSPFHNNKKKTNNETNPAAIWDDKYGRLPLHWACASMHRDLDNTIKVVGYLVDIYPDGVTMKDYNGQTPLDLLKQHRNKHSVATLALEGIIRRSLDRRHSMMKQQKNHLFSSDSLSSESSSSSSCFLPPVLAAMNMCKQSKLDALREIEQELEQEGPWNRQQQGTPDVRPNNSSLTYQNIEAVIDTNTSTCFQQDLNEVSKDDGIESGVSDHLYSPSSLNTTTKTKLVRFQELNTIMVYSSTSSDTSSTRNEDDDYSQPNKESCDNLLQIKCNHHAEDLQTTKKSRMYDV